MSIPINKVTICFVLLTIAALAQVDRATLNGTITDSSGAVVPGAAVAVTGTATGFHREVVTGGAGTYSFTALPIGDYTVRITARGMKTLEFQSLRLEVGENRTLDAQLQVGELTNVVRVEAIAPPIDRSTAEFGGVIGSQQVNEIPLDGREWAGLMALAPGAVDVGGGHERSIHFIGHSRDDDNFTMDGIDASGIQEQPQKANVRLQVNLDSIAEFRVNTADYTAEYGDMGGAQINVVTKSGTNQFHGDVFEFLRNSALDTRSPFDPSNVPPFRLNQFGGSVGGAIVKDKSFFFVSYEGLRQRLSTTNTSFVPSAAVRSQVLATSPQLKPIIDAYPVGQSPVDSQTDEIIRTDNNPVREDSGLVRFDQRFSDKTTLYARYSVDDSISTVLNGALGSYTSTPIRPTNAVVDVTHIFSPRTLNEFKFGVNRSAYTDPTHGIFPVDISIGGSAYDDLPNSALDEEIGTTFSWIDSLTHTSGRHTLKFGGEIRRVRLNNSGNAIDTTTVAFASIDDFIHNRVDSIDDNAAEGIHGMRHTLYAGFAQDEFKVTPNLTLNLGLRYEFYSVTHEVLNRAAIFDIPGCGGQCPPGTPYYFPDYTNFGPRLGLAWSPARFHGKTVIRSGYGIFYSPNQNDDYSDPAESTAGRFALSSADVPNLSYPITPFLAALQNQGLAPKALDRHRRDGYYETWNLTVQSELGHSFVGQIGYLGGEGHHLFDQWSTNLIDPATGKRPLANFGKYGIKGNTANNNIHSLQAQVKRAFTGGFLWQANYMWSHAITDASSGAGEQVQFENSNCRACDRSNSPYDFRHSFTTSLVYQLPFGPGKRFLPVTGAAGKLVGGWELSAVGSARSGLPINVTVSRSSSVMLDGNASNQRPDLVPGVSLTPPGGQTISEWLNPAAFAVPAPFTWGDLGRYIAVGPHEWEGELALSKRTVLTERFTLNFRAEAFNLLNHPNYANPVSNFSSGAFGLITSVLNSGPTGTGGTRKIEFMLRLEF
ncbi:MAG TPA: TonB-dependent receptor [Verrucomicrobiae bacterium]|nr:TonB-dependent receptor [Verrucomicrobiae bacterium]